MPVDVLTDLIQDWMPGAVRDLLGTDAVALPDTFIRDGLPGMMTVSRVNQHVPGWAATTGANRQLLDEAVVAYLAAYSTQRLKTLFAQGERAFDAGGGDYKWAERKAELLVWANAALNRLQNALTPALAEVPTVLVAGGPSKSYGYRSPSSFRPRLPGSWQ